MQLHSAGSSGHRGHLVKGPRLKEEKHLWRALGLPLGKHVIWALPKEKKRKETIFLPASGFFVFLFMAAPVAYGGSQARS